MNLSDTPVLILAGGLGTRLRPVLSDRPKGLAPVGNSSFLEIQIQLLARQGAKHVVLCVGYQGDQICARLGDGYSLGVKIDYSFDPATGLLGTAGALKLAEKFFAPRALVLNGDTYFDISYPQLLTQHLEAYQSHQAITTIAIARNIDGTRYGNVVLDETSKRIIAFKEKDVSDRKSNWVSGGAYVIERSLLDYVQPGQLSSLECDIFPSVLSSDQYVSAATFDFQFFDIGTPDAWNHFAAYYKGSLE